MRLVKQTTLFFQEGNSDKVYEISLCTVGNDRYVVNFRYGRRGAQLKEGSKTPAPVTLAQAEAIFDAVETEKLNKGYAATEGIAAAEKPAAFVLDEALLAITEHWKLLPADKNRAIIRRLHAAVTGTSSGLAHHWKLTRVIWKAGEYRVQETLPYLVKLFNQGNTMQQYCCVWAMVRMKQVATLPFLHQLYQHASPLIARLAGAGLLQLLQGNEKQLHLEMYRKVLPDNIKSVLLQANYQQLSRLLTSQLAEARPVCDWLVSLYLLSTEQSELKLLLKNAFAAMPLKPPFFKQVRAVFKLAELLDDFEILGLLSCKIERDTEMYSHYLTMEEAARVKVFVSEIDEDIVPAKESKKSSSKVAYSNKTRWYLHRRTLRRLQMLGKAADRGYVKLATAILLSYKKKLDFKPHYSEHTYHWNRNSYERVEMLFPANAQAIYLHQILSAEHPSLVLARQRWQVKTAQTVQPKKATNNTGTVSEGMFRKLMRLFTGKKAVAEVPPAADTPAATTPNENGTPYLHLWNNMPQAYVQLLLQAELDEIHQFAIENLSVHPGFENIKARLGSQELCQLLLSPFEKPAAFAFALVQEKYAAVEPPAAIIAAMINSIHASARQSGITWAENNKTLVCADPDFIAAILTARDEVVRQWCRQFLLTAILDNNVKKAASGKLIVHFLQLPEGTSSDYQLITDTLDISFNLLAQELNGIDVHVLGDLLMHPAPDALLFGLKLIQEAKYNVAIDELPAPFLQSLLQHNNRLAREMGLTLMGRMSKQGLYTHKELILFCLLSPEVELREGARQLLSRVIQDKNGFGSETTAMLLPWLLRKETAEGMQAYISSILRKELAPFLSGIDKTMALNLLYSTYSPAQEVGAYILEQHTHPEDLTMAQIIALGSHENRAVREWSWRLYEQQIPRIRFEKEIAIKLLESKWDDTRSFAMQFFKQHFTPDDWSPELLITLADSVKPDIEAYGRELITLFFKEENGLTYLLKLSQHPGEKMQLFATNYLEQFAANDVAKLQSLEFYFRSVLTRVNKSRIAKKRIYSFLHAEGIKSEAAAILVSRILTDISATIAIADKAKCIDILLQLSALYPVHTPLQLKETECR